jgi:hypothetical protein
MRVYLLRLRHEEPHTMHQNDGKLLQCLSNFYLPVNTSFWKFIAGFLPPKSEKDFVLITSFVRDLLQ